MMNEPPPAVRLALAIAGGEDETNLEMQIVNVVRALRNGFLYGVQVRGPHALANQALFGRGPLLGRLRRMVDLVMQHAGTLGRFAFIYKGLTTILSWGGGAADLRTWHSAVSGFVGGYVVWGEETSISTQVNLYIFSRVCMALARNFAHTVVGRVAVPKNAYRLVAGCCWALVMSMYEADVPLQTSLRHSMDFIYGDSERPGGWTGRLPMVALGFMIADQFNNNVRTRRPSIM